MIEVDARGLSCPIPVIRVREAIEKHPGEEIRVIIDTMVTVENVTRMAENKGMQAAAPVEQDDEFVLDLKPA